MKNRAYVPGNGQLGGGTLVRTVHVCLLHFDRNGDLLSKRSDPYNACTIIGSAQWPLKLRPKRVRVSEFGSYLNELYMAVSRP
jgi:hypothetical protein